MLYKELVGIYEKLDSTSKRLEKIFYISELIKKTEAKELGKIMLMSQGKIFPELDDRKIGVASKIVIKAITKATGISEDKIEDEWKKAGDLGDVAEILIKRKKQSSLFPKELTLTEVFNNLQSLPAMEGKGSVDSKLNLISDMFIHATPIEAKYLARTLVDNLRIGIGAGSMRDALVWAFFSDELNLKFNYETNEIEFSEDKRKEYNEIVERVRHAYDMTNDFGKVAVCLKEKGIKGLDELNLEVGKPINVMLFQKAKNIAEAFVTVGKPAALEFKYDGFRMAVHKTGDVLRIFTRRLEDVTMQFPDVIVNLQGKISADSCIIEGEAVGIDSKGRYLPFQNVSERIRRKYDIKTLSEKYPMELNLFDIIYLNGKSLINTPFIERRKLLEKTITTQKGKIVLSRQIITSDEKEAEEFYAESLKEGQEGIMAKSLEAIYKPGARVGFGLKIKPTMEPLDLAIIGAEYGEGKRSGWLTSFDLACNQDGEFLEIGKVSTGLKELEEQGVSYTELTKLLKPLITKSKGKYVEVRPEIVIEVGYEEIQRSPTYSSGYALRFPRFLRLRVGDKTTDDINTIEDVERLYSQQRGRT
jgi:DNA ligase-1